MQLFIKIKLWPDGKLFLLTIPGTEPTSVVEDALGEKSKLLKGIPNNGDRQLANPFLATIYSHKMKRSITKKRTIDNNDEDIDGEEDDNDDGWLVGQSECHETEMLREQ